MYLNVYRNILENVLIVAANFRDPAFFLLNNFSNKPHLAFDFSSLVIGIFIHTHAPTSCLEGDSLNMFHELIPCHSHETVTKYLICILPCYNDWNGYQVHYIFELCWQRNCIQQYMRSVQTIHSMTISHSCNKCNCYQWLLCVAVSILNTRTWTTAHQNGMQSSLKLLFTHVYTSAISACTVKTHLLLFWAVQGSCRVENSLLCIVEELRNVLQILGRTLRKKGNVYVNALSKSNPGAYSITFTSTFSQIP